MQFAGDDITGIQQFLLTKRWLQVWTESRTNWMMQPFRKEQEDADSAAKEIQQCTKTTMGGKKAPEQPKSCLNVLAGG